ncbi:hypothetical protein G3O00_14980 [Burkholderia sp. Ac-20384]|uniref:hypothetical protein n=1 Tax=Burkholderia sp. Ac-20384 TaxID=2703902 RepID=UPI00198026C6|nr:hypothetical protein [Burkholderia sp. Ac-20384]MBN3824912.1 hypothetical protein [Burkholderia sp. Ac-20384]
MRLIDEFLNKVTVIEKSVHDYLVGIIRGTAPHLEGIRIVPISETREADEGWDAVIDDGAVPMFLQYKLPSFTTMGRRDWPEHLLQRRACNFEDDGGVFHFALREKSQKSALSQHQLLVNLQDAGEHAYYTSTVYRDFRKLWGAGHGFGLPGSGAWRAWHTVSLLHNAPLDKYFVPWVSGLIFIPPHAAVTGPPESHRFFYNELYEVSLHSDPMYVRGLTLEDVVSTLRDRRSNAPRVTVDRLENGYVPGLFETLLGDNENKRELAEQLIEWYETVLARLQHADMSDAERRWTALRIVLWDAFDLDLMLATRS